MTAAVEHFRADVRLRAKQREALHAQLASELKGDGLGAFRGALNAALIGVPLWILAAVIWHII